jgi:hypothetical protein
MSAGAFRHSEDQGDIAMLVTDNGLVFLVCMKEPTEHTWLLQATRAESADRDTRRDAAEMFRYAPEPSALLGEAAAEIAIRLETDN